MALALNARECIDAAAECKLGPHVHYSFCARSWSDSARAHAKRKEFAMDSKVVKKT